MTRKKKTLVSIILFLAVFGALVTAATFTDLNVSKLLTAEPLKEHLYLTNSAFGAAFEAIGSAPVYFAFAFGFQLLFWYFVRKKELKKSTKILSGTALFIASTVAHYILAMDTMGYIFEHINISGTVDESMEKAGFLIISEVAVACCFSVLGTLAVRNFTVEQTEKLCSFAVATIVVAAVSTIAVNLIKIPFGRIRFRAMNMYPDNEQYGYNAFAGWYEMSGQWLNKDTLRQLFGTTDALKSFPSGHTCAAGASYVLIMLCDALDIKSKKLRVMMWVLPVVVTGIVAVSRIVVGAHFFSDVLFGGTTAFVCTIIAREIFICKGANVKALLGKDK